jgi:hypothetical protein
MYIYQQPTWPDFTWQHEHLEGVGKINRYI